MPVKQFVFNKPCFLGSTKFYSWTSFTQLEEFEYILILIHCSGRNLKTLSILYFRSSMILKVISQFQGLFLIFCMTCIFFNLKCEENFYAKKISSRIYLELYEKWIFSLCWTFSQWQDYSISPFFSFYLFQFICFVCMWNCVWVSPARFVSYWKVWRNVLRFTTKS